MRKLKLQMQVSVDGFVAGPNGEMDWMVWKWDDAITNYVIGITEPIDCIVLGRKLAQGFIPTWASRAANPDTADKFTEKMDDTSKIVFTKTLNDSDAEVLTWKNTKLAKGDLKEEILKLKNQEGKDIVAYGGGDFVSNLIALELIDEYHLFINPVILGTGMPVFNNHKGSLKLNLIKTITSSTGLVILFYEPVK
ncbi:MAG: dihydrofolate reductase family protein [Ginsengibacter sp.]